MDMVIGQLQIGPEGPTRGPGSDKNVMLGSPHFATSSWASGGKWSWGSTLSITLIGMICGQKVSYIQPRETIAILHKKKSLFHPSRSLSSISNYVSEISNLKSQVMCLKEITLQVNFSHLPWPSIGFAQTCGGWSITSDLSIIHLIYQYHLSVSCHQHLMATDKPLVWNVYTHVLISVCTL